MPGKDYRVIDSFLPGDDDWDDEWDDEDYDEIAKNLTMKNIFINTKIRKRKFTPEIAKKIKFGSVVSLMNAKDGPEGYLGAYSETNFFTYRFQKIHEFQPDVLTIRRLKPYKFIQDLFKFCDIPNNSYFKALNDDRGEISLNTMVIAFVPSERNEIDNDLIYLCVDGDEAVLYYNSNYEKAKDGTFNLILSLIKNCIEPKITKNKIYVVYQSANGFEKKGFEVKKVNINIESNYNDGFSKVSDEIVKGLNDKNKTNLVILKGAPGVGKTSYIRYLIHKLDKNIIFISPDMVNHITDPSFIPFLINNNDAVLIIEDAEPALGKRGANGRTGAVSNILNLTDGLLSDCLNISIVATINTNDKDIDEALLRKGRLLKNYTFEKLNIDKSKMLLKKLGRGDIEVKEPMTLAEIYFYNDDNNSTEYERKKVGFKN